MSHVVQDTQQEFWRPPSPVVADGIVVREAIPTMAEACSGCGTEFLLGSRFCHACGGRRTEALNASARVDSEALAGLWQQCVARIHSMVRTLSAGDFWRTIWQTFRQTIEFPSWLRYLHFHEIKSWVGLPTASLIAFVAGVSCLAGALMVGLLTAKTFVDWQAIQFYRAEWLLAATAAFVAGILLKKPAARDRE
jgi:hypothetical protein